MNYRSEHSDPNFSYTIGHNTVNQSSSSVDTHSSTLNSLSVNPSEGHAQFKVRDRAYTFTFGSFFFTLASFNSYQSMHLHIVVWLFAIRARVVY